MWLYPCEGVLIHVQHWPSATSDILLELEKNPYVEPLQQFLPYFESLSFLRSIKDRTQNQWQFHQCLVQIEALWLHYSCCLKVVVERRGGYVLGAWVYFTLWLCPTGPFSLSTPSSFHSLLRLSQPPLSPKPESPHRTVILPPHLVSVEYLLQTRCLGWSTIRPHLSSDGGGHCRNGQLLSC